MIITFLVFDQASVFQGRCPWYKLLRGEFQIQATESKRSFKIIIIIKCGHWTLSSIAMILNIKITITIMLFHILLPSQWSSAGTPASGRSGGSRPRRRESLTRAYRWLWLLLFCSVISWQHLVRFSDSLALPRASGFGNLTRQHHTSNYRVHEFSCKLDLPKTQPRSRGSSSRSHKVIQENRTNYYNYYHHYCYHYYSTNQINKMMSQSQEQQTICIE